MPRVQADQDLDFPRQFKCPLNLVDDYPFAVFDEARRIILSGAEGRRIIEEAHDGGPGQARRPSFNRAATA